MNEDSESLVPSKPPRTPSSDTRHPISGPEASEIKTSQEDELDIINKISSPTYEDSDPDNFGNKKNYRFVSQNTTHHPDTDSVNKQIKK